MKKIVGLIICLALLGGIAAVFLINDMAFTTLISQDQTKITGMLNRAEKKVQDADSYEFVISKDHFKNGVTINREKIQLQSNNADSTLWAIKEVKDADGKPISTTEYYYDGIELYRKITYTNNTTAFDAVTITYENTLAEILDFELVDDEFLNITGFSDRTVESLKAEDKVGDDVVGKKQTASHIAFSFSPFYLGERLVMEATGTCMTGFSSAVLPADYDGIIIEKVSYEWALSLMGNLKQKVFKAGSDKEYMQRTYDYNQVGGVTVKTLTNEEKTNWGV
ncbi:MAG: hypothetical protein LBN07_00645 [Christensenellaceae bacterium]|jgi:hypothetical protein|nr:hypothetical protein [Christensenellaceae bacterium]